MKAATPRQDIKELRRVPDGGSRSMLQIYCSRLTLFGPQRLLFQISSLTGHKHLPSVVRTVAQPLLVRVAFSLEFAPGLRLPPAVRARLERIFGDIAQWLDALPEDSGYLKAVDGEVAELNLQRWQIEYRVDRKPRGIVVMGAYHQVKAA